jgi:hypothetical protein
LFDANSQLHRISNALHRQWQEVRQSVDGCKGSKEQLHQSCIGRLHVLKFAITCADMTEQHLLTAGLHLQHLSYQRGKCCVVKGQQHALPQRQQV